MSECCTVLDANTRMISRITQGGDVALARVLIGLGRGTIAPGESQTFRAGVTQPVVCEALHTRFTQAAPRENSGLIVESFRLGTEEFVMGGDGDAIEALQTNLVSRVLFPEMETLIRVRNVSDVSCGVVFDIRGHLESELETIARQGYLIEDLQSRLHAETLLRLGWR